MKRSMQVQSCHRLELRAAGPLHTRETGSEVKKKKTLLKGKNTSHRQGREQAPTKNQSHH